MQLCTSADFSTPEDSINNMDDEIERARQLHAEMKEDHGTLPFWPEEESLKSIRDGYSNNAIDAQYREFAERIRNRFRDEAYEILEDLRREYGRCPIIKEETIIEWLKAKTPKDEFRQKYIQTKTQHDHQLRAQRLSARMGMAKPMTPVTIPQILYSLERYADRTDEQIMAEVWEEAENQLMKGDSGWSFGFW
jgi:hypothetical protein